MRKTIRSADLDDIVKFNAEIRDEVQRKVLQFSAMTPRIRGISAAGNAFEILKSFGLLLIPVEDECWPGAIFSKDGKTIPVINTARPRVNQNFEALHEIYHLLFGDVSENSTEDRKADLFAAEVLLSGVLEYFSSLSGSDFLYKIFSCMAVFQSPYKAVLIALYENAVHSGNRSLAVSADAYFDIEYSDFSRLFGTYGFDEAFVSPSNVVSFDILKGRISAKMAAEPWNKEHTENAGRLAELTRELRLMTV